MQDVFRSVFRSVFRNIFRVPNFSFFLGNGTLKAIGNGSATPTFTRATTATGRDVFNRLHTCASGQPRQDGYDVVTNLITASEDMTDAAYNVDDGVTSNTATQIVYDGSPDIDFGQGVNITDDGSGAGGRTFVFSVYIKLISGTILTDAALQLRIEGNAMTNANQSIGDNVVTTESRRFSVSSTTDASGTVVTPVIRCDNAITIEATKWQLEEVTGKLNHNPSDYVSTGVLSAPFRS